MANANCRQFALPSPIILLLEYECVQSNLVIEKANKQASKQTKTKTKQQLNFRLNQTGSKSSFINDFNKINNIILLMLFIPLHPSLPGSQMLITKETFRNA